jgi:hypothetical protein
MWMGADVHRAGSFVEGPDTLAGARPVCESGNARMEERGASFIQSISRVHMVRRPVLVQSSECHPRYRCLSLIMDAGIVSFGRLSISFQRL